MELDTVRQRALREGRERGGKGFPYKIVLDRFFRRGNPAEELEGTNDREDRGLFETNEETR